VDYIRETDRLKTVLFKSKGYRKYFVRLVGLSVCIIFEYGLGLTEKTIISRLISHSQTLRRRLSSSVQRL